MRYLIIGNSVAAIGAVRAIRAIDQTGEITMLSREQYPAYGRPLISYLLGGLITEKGMPYIADSFYDQHAVTLRLNTEVVAVDGKKHTVTTAAG
ncbi:MAG: FAD-dependent oxidoreductase, partial [Trichlorobacter sp.]